MTVDAEGNEAAAGTAVSAMRRPADVASGAAFAGMTSFIGRRGLLRATMELLGSCPAVTARQRGPVRLVTLTGAGGVGKTRLLEQLATGLADYYDQVALVPLAGLSARFRATGVG